MSISNPPSLSSLSDPGSLAKLQILLVPVHTSTPLQDHTFNYWSNLLKRHTVLRGDELARPSPSTHTRGSTSNPRSRFLPASSSTSISRGGAPNHVHLVYPSHPPARHLANLSLLRIAAFPLVVIGIAAEQPQGYSIEEEDGDIGGSSKTPTVSTFREREKSIEESFGEALAEVFPPSSPFPLVKRLIVVPPDAPISPRDSPKKNGHSGRFTKTKGEVLFAPSEGVEGWLGRLLGEVVGDALGELGELASDTCIGKLISGYSAGDAFWAQDSIVDTTTLSHFDTAPSTPRPTLSRSPLSNTDRRPLAIQQYNTGVYSSFTIGQRSIAQWSGHLAHASIDTWR